LVIKKSNIEFTRYVLISAIALLADVLLLIIITEVGGLHYLLSAVISYCTGLVVSYKLSTKYVFRYRKYVGKKKEFILYAVTGVFGLIIMSTVLLFITEYLEVSYFISKLYATVIVFLSVYFLRKFLAQAYMYIQITLY